MTATRQQRSPIRGNTDFEYNLAIKQGNQRRLKTLLKHKITPPKSSLIYAYERGHMDLLPILLDAGANPNYVGHNGWTIVGDCILKRDVSTLRLLLNRNADPNQGFGGLPAIVLAARAGNLDILRLLMDAGASLFDDPLIAPNAFFESIARGHTDIVKFLIAHGVSCTSRKPFGKTAIQWAAEKGTPEIQELIRNRKHKAKRI